MAPGGKTWSEIALVVIAIVSILAFIWGWDISAN